MDKFKRRDDILLAYMLEGELDEVYTTLNSFQGDTKIIEWGSGGSTIGWLYNLKPNQTLISIEHDYAWYEKVLSISNQKKIEDNLQVNFKYYHIPKILPLGPHVGQFDWDDGAWDYMNGVGADYLWDANVYFVDGINRLQNALHVFEKAQNRDAIVYLHDYGSNKHRYAPLLTTFPRYEIFTLPISNDWNEMIKMYLK